MRRHDNLLGSWPREHRVDVAKSDNATYQEASQILVFAHVEPFSSGFVTPDLV